MQKGDDGYVWLFIETEGFGPLVIASFIVSYSMFEISWWPEDMAKQIMFWYRQYIPSSYPLFVVIPDIGKVAELPANSEFRDIENALAIVLPPA